jgi:hypothetical protein
MKAPERVLLTALTSSTAVFSLIGARVKPLVVPTETPLPYVTWRRIGIQRTQTLGSPLGTPKLTLEYSIYGATYDQAREVADAMRVVLDGYGGTVDNTTVKQTSLENESDDFVSLGGAELPPAYQITQVYDVIWQEI